jgi:hypothetical protein
MGEATGTWDETEVVSIRLSHCVRRFLMPKRTNEFQKIVYLIKKHSATDGAIVEESCYLYDNAAKIKREVDVCITRIVGENRTIISIECTKLNKKADVPWVDKMLGKHRDLPTDVLILYSHRGFSKSAIRKAAYYDKPIVAMQTLDESDAEGLFGGASSLWAKYGELTATKVILTVPATQDLPAENIAPFPDNAIYNRLEEPQINVSDYVPWLLQQPFAMPEFLKRGDPAHKGFTLRMAPATDYFGNQLYLLKNDQTPNLLRPIDSITITGNAAFAVTSVPIEHGKLGDDAVAWGTVSFQRSRVIVVASRAGTGKPKVSVEFF